MVVDVEGVLVVSMACCCRGGGGGAADADVEADTGMLLLLLLLLLLSKPTTPVKSEKSKSGRLRSPVLVSTGKYLSNSFCLRKDEIVSGVLRIVEASLKHRNQEYQLTQSISSIKTSPPLVFPELDPANNCPLVTLFCRLSPGVVELSVCCW